MARDENMDLFHGIEKFFQSIKDKCSNEEEYIAEILKARGFLLEDDRITLSDNSHRDDAVYLNKLLTEENIGKVKAGKIIIFDGKNIESIFYKDSRIGGEAFCDGETWKKFVHNSFAPKISLRWLEPFVGRYVKAISACGVATWCSCDGNHPTEKKLQHILINFVSEPNELWHKIICKKLLVKNFNLKFILNRRSLKFIFTKENKWDTYINLNRVGEFLYNNRVKLRQIRREASDGISLKDIKNLSAEELGKIFSERANKLLNATEFIFTH